MATQLDICREALHEIGAADIGDINERSPEAAACRMVFDSSLDYILRATLWSFATKRMPLTKYEGELPVDWAYAYVYPQDCLALIELLPPRRSSHAGPIRYHDGQGMNYAPMGDTVPFEREISETDVLVIYTNLDNAVAKYTRRITNIDLMDSMACQALKWRIASRLSKTLKGDDAVSQQCAAMFTQIMNQAAAMNRKENKTMPIKNSTLIGRRFGR